MKSLLLRWLLNAVALIFTAYLVPGIEVKSFGAALIAALVLGILNAVIRPLLLFLTLPINFFTLGLFTLVINGFMLFLVAKLVSGFVVTGFFSAVIGALVLAVVSFLLNALVTD